MEARPREVRLYETAQGNVPFDEWMETIEGLDIYGVVMNRLDRVEDGNLGHWNPVGEGVGEFVFDVGPGYRLYFGQDGDFIILLNGGNKKTQSRDIKKAKEFWGDYNA